MRNRSVLPVDLPARPVDEAALAVAAEFQTAVDALARSLGLSLADDAHATAWALEAQGFSRRSRALQAVASANAAVARLREAALGGRCTESMAYRVRRARDELAEARAYVAAALEAERSAA